MATPRGLGASSTYGKANLTLAYPEHFSPTFRTDALGCWSPVLHGYRLSLFHFPFGTALHTIGLHLPTSLFVVRKQDKLFSDQESSI